MKEKAEDLREELNRVIVEHAANGRHGPTPFPQELIDRVIAYIVQQRARGVTIETCSKHLYISQARLHYWLYGRNKLVGSLQKPRRPELRAVQLSSETVSVPDGVLEPRFTICSPAGWEVKNLTLQELTLLLRSLT